MAARTAKKTTTSTARGRPTLARRVTKKGRVTKVFVDQVAQFIERYRPALEALAKQ
ncbi:MAG: hypothetical protein ACREJU_14290 [Nitrospiraceae bacterium]